MFTIDNKRFNIKYIKFKMIFKKALYLINIDNIKKNSRIYIIII